MSMNIGSSPQLTPAVTIESPRSPPKGFGVHPSGSNLTDRGLNKSPTRFGPSTAVLPGRPTSRPVTPGDGATVADQADGAQNLKRLSNVPSAAGANPSKSSSVPPLVNRAEKPLIPSKNTSLLNRPESNTLFPMSQRTSSEDRVSPFSTPPSSPERASPERSAPSVENTAKAGLSRSMPSSQIGFQPPVHREVVEKRQTQPKTRPRDARELGFSEKAVATDLPAEKPLLPPPALEKRQTQPVATKPYDARALGFSIQKSAARDITEDRPGLPPRHIGTETNPKTYTRNPTASNRRESPPRISIDRANRPSKPVFTSTVPPIDTAPHFPPPPKRNTISNAAGDSYVSTPQSAAPAVSRATKYTTSSTPVQQAPSRALPEDSDEVEQAVEDTSNSRTNFPDSSQANRRPPLLGSGPQEIHTKNDTRIFDVCGQHVCTTGYFTRVWDLSTGEQLMGLSHGETVKVLSVVFKPGERLEDEGSRLWLGTTLGELHEVEIATQSIVSTRSAHSRREIIKILRHKKELWTLDDDGRLLVWPPDESGAPNLQYSHQSHIVPKGHTFSMVIGDKLWYATGKEIRIFRPGDNTSFQVVQKPLSHPHAGDVTSGAFTSKLGGRVYFGHANGKFTIYSTKDYSCLGIVNARDYKINCLTMVGDYLWAGYKTGMIYVYDTSSDPWKVKKDWHAHDNPVSGLLLDPSSIWTLRRLQVTSLGADNYIRIWDGMLEDDWLETEMQSKDIEYCDFREIKAAVLTWNAGASIPSAVRDGSFVRDAINAKDPPEILIFGFQELVDLEDKSITAKSILGKLGGKKHDHPDHEHMSRQYRAWKDQLSRWVDDYMPPSVSYQLLHTASLVGLFSCVFVRQEERKNIRNLNSSEVKCGMGGRFGNKGALVLRFVLDDSSLCFINCHLAAGQTQTAHRNNDIATILEAESLPLERDPSIRTDLFVGGGDGTQILDHEICILNGDLNYRIDSMPRDTVINAIKKNNLNVLLERDQLLVSRKRNPGFRLRVFNEAPITFAPTYKYDVGTDNYDSSEKKRSPAWCDRLLYRGVGRLKQLDYRRHEVRVSDHRPVSGTFMMRIKTISPKKRIVAWERCQRAFGEVQRRMAAEARYVIASLIAASFFPEHIDHWLIRLN